MILRLVTLCLLAALPACQTTRHPMAGPVTRVADVLPGSPEAAVLAEVLSLYVDLSARDWPAFADHFWDDAVLGAIWQPPGEPAPRVVLTTIPQFVAAAPEGPGSREIFEEWLNDAELRVHNDLAQVWSHYGARFGDPGAVMSWEGIDSMTLLEHDGRWRVISIAYVADH